MPGFFLTPAAQSDLDGIWDYTVSTWGQAQAIQYTRDIQTTCQGLSDGTQFSRSAGHIREGYSKAPSGEHMLYFRRNGENVEIIRILHQSMDVDRHL